jgi:hypothetical protein
MSFTVFAAKSTHVPGTKYCVYDVINESLVATGVIFSSFDTFVFLAISYEISSSHSDAKGIRWQTLISGEALPRVSRAILQGGQQYYLFVSPSLISVDELTQYSITLCLQIPVLILTAVPSVAPIYKLMLTFPLGCLSASMASRIFRNMQKREPKQSSESEPTVLSEVGFTTIPHRAKATNDLESLQTRAHPDQRTIAITFADPSNASPVSAEGTRL